MKIAMVGQFPPHIGGVGVHIHTLAKELIKQGHEVYVITYPHKDIKDIDGIHVIGTKGVNIPGLRGLFFAINAKKELKRLIKEENIDIIHGHYLFPAGWASVRAGKATKTKTYVTSHGSDMFELYKKQAFTRPLIKKVLKDADVVLAVSNALKDEIINTKIPNIEEKTKLHWNSVDVNKFKTTKENESKFKKELVKEFNIEEDKPIILFIGNIIKRKNVDLLIEAKEIMDTSANLVIVGDGPHLEDLKKRYEKEHSNGNIDNVYFTGSRNDVEDIIPSCDLLVLPSHSESFGLVLIEALACGKPVIGSDVGGIREIITEEVGLLIDPNDASDLANTIDRILGDEELMEKFKSNARNRAMDFGQTKLPYDELN
ncbi:glycosyltransferase family 4 protein [Methanobrevibacter sp.]|uniref:glycosyltransferase family 4 protein n=1 Tax=Methanobrevibacter sp. TaxID=66852 RepID=UPI0025F040E3|nr:glycosyltransferase family 4 protein [Methanobrevibacter sp.]MBQ2961813.1 glycosyltransferase family 4 protein [Methanobrevibacter sp.]